MTRTAKPAKLTPAMAATLDRFNHAIPWCLSSLGHFYCGNTKENGIVRSRHNHAQTVEALGRLGLIEVLRASRGDMADELRITCTLPAPQARIQAMPPHPRCVTWEVRIMDATGLPLASISGLEMDREGNVEVPAGTVEYIAATLRAVGWQIIE